MTSAEKLRRRADNKRAHALARVEACTSVNPAEITERIFTSQEEEELPESMCDGHVMRRARGALTNEACVNRICDLVSRGVTETVARQYVGVSATEWGRWRLRNECYLHDKMALAIELQHIATADECIKIIDDPGLLTQPELDENGNPLGPTVDQKLKHAVARVQHRQWKLEKRSPDYVPKSVSVTKNIYQDVRDATSPEEAMRRYSAILDLRPED
jgi:hypothetical protein